MTTQDTDNTSPAAATNTAPHRASYHQPRFILAAGLPGPNGEHAAVVWDGCLLPDDAESKRSVAGAEKQCWRLYEVGPTGVCNYAGRSSTDLGTAMAYLERANGRDVSDMYERFAAAALQGMLSVRRDFLSLDVAHMAYQMAAIMVAMRGVSPDATEAQWNAAYNKLARAGGSSWPTGVVAAPASTDQPTGEQ